MLSMMQLEQETLLVAVCKLTLKAMRYAGALAAWGKDAWDVDDVE